MGLRFNMRTLFVVTAILAGVFYLCWRSYSRYHPTGHIDDGNYATQVEQEENGLLFTFTASTKPIKRLTFEIYEQGKPDLLFFVKQGFPPCQRKVVRILLNTEGFAALEHVGEVLVIRLPTKLQGSNYRLQLPNNKTYELLDQTDHGFQIHQMIDEQGRLYELDNTINWGPVDFLTGESLDPGDVSEVYVKPAE